jgi:hypothetical protein
MMKHCYHLLNRMIFISKIEHVSTLNRVSDVLSVTLKLRAITARYLRHMLLNIYTLVNKGHYYSLHTSINALISYCIQSRTVLYTRVLIIIYI